jgi:hypothetical protein
MKTRVLWSVWCLAILLLPGGCSKSHESDQLPPMEFDGVKVDTPRLGAVFQSASPELQQQVSDAVNKMRYKQYLQAMMGLDEVLKNPALNEKQKELINQVMGQLKELVAKGPTPPGR